MGDSFENEWQVYLFVLSLKCRRVTKPGRGWGIAKKMSSSLTFVFFPSVQENYQRFALYMQKWQCNENLTDCGINKQGFYKLTVPTVCSF